jgi:hypothetical protein
LGKISENYWKVPGTGMSEFGDNYQIQLGLEGVFFGWLFLYRGLPVIVIGFFTIYNHTKTAGCKADNLGKIDD